MSDHPREAERHLKRLYICDDIWYGVFSWFGRAELGLKIAPICARFDGLVDRHLRTIRWTLGNTNFCSNSDELFFVSVESVSLKLKESGILDVPAPPNLVGFSKIQISFVDENVIAFLHRIRHLFDNVNISLIMPHIRSICHAKDLTHIWPFIASRLYKISIVCLFLLNLDALLVSPTVPLWDCPNLRVISTGRVFPMAIDRRCTTNSLFIWLHTPRSDGLPKVLSCRGFPNIANKLEGLKRKFIYDKSAVSYIIFVMANDHYVGGPLEFENGSTRERMTFQLIDASHPADHNWVLKRGPIWWKESQWTESERQAKSFFGQKEPAFINLIS